MIFGELAEQSADYQTGHNTGTNRALGYMQQCFQELAQANPDRQYTAQEICDIADAIRADWQYHCNTFGMGINDDRLEPLIYRRVQYVMTDEPETTYTGTVERDSFGRPYIQDEKDAGVIVYDTGVLLTVTEIE